MFGSPKKQPFIKMAQLSTLIAEGVEITGNCSSPSGMRIDGRIKGDVTGRRKVDAKAPSLLVLSANGHIEGAIRCGDAVINGTVVGDLDVEHRLELQSDAQASPERSAIASCRWTSARACRGTCCASRRRRRRATSSSSAPTRRPSLRSGAETTANRSRRRAPAARTAPRAASRIGMGCGASPGNASASMLASLRAARRDVRRAVRAFSGGARRRRHDATGSSIGRARRAVRAGRGTRQLRWRLPGRGRRLREVPHRPAPAGSIGVSQQRIVRPGVADAAHALPLVREVEPGSGQSIDSVIHRVARGARLGDCRASRRAGPPGSVKHRRQPPLRQECSARPRSDSTLQQRSRAW